MALESSNLQFKEHTDLLDILRNKYAEIDDAQTVSAVEELLQETTQATQEEALNAEEIIQSETPVALPTPPQSLTRCCILPQ
jgi:hypothetical protein